MFSGGDAGSQATLPLPELTGKYQIHVNWLNSSDSPAMELSFGDLKLTLPDHETLHTNSKLQLRDLGVHTLNLKDSAAVTLTVQGDVTGKGNAWIAVDYFEFVPVS